MRGSCSCPFHGYDPLEGCKWCLEVKEDLEEKEVNTMGSWRSVAGPQSWLLVCMAHGRVGCVDCGHQRGLKRLIGAAKKGDAGVLEDILAAESIMRVLNEKDEGGRTALHWAAVRGRGDCVNLLLAARADPNLVDESGEVALHRVSLYGYVGIAKALIKAKAYVSPQSKVVIISFASCLLLNNEQQKGGRTPLHLAVKNNYESLAWDLLESGASMTEICEDPTSLPRWVLNLVHGKGLCNCRKACDALGVVFRRKGFKDLVPMIRVFLWDSRRNSQWGWI